MYANVVRHLALEKRLTSPGLIALVLGSQVYWSMDLWRRLLRRFAGSARLIIAVAMVGWYGIGFALSLGADTRHYSALHFTIVQAVFAAPFQIWLFGSIGAFLVIVPYKLAVLAIHAIRSPEQSTTMSECVSAVPASPTLLRAATRREFLRKAGGTVAAAPFALGAYGVIHGRLEFETTHPRLHLEHLPTAFNGFRIAQLSDIHIGPFMGEREIRRTVDHVNALRPDLIVLTGDFVTWDASAQSAVVAALAGLRAPFGIYGCLGNHELYTHVESSITRLFQETGTTILRQSAATIEVPAVGGLGAPAQFQLLGVDYVPTASGAEMRAFEAPAPQFHQLAHPGLVNILLAHDPNCFDRAAQLGIALTISGHTHGGQIALLTPELSLARLVTPYVAGHYRQGASQLYVNRGLGTIGVPMRIFAPPEITLFELAASPPPGSSTNRGGV